MHWQWPQLGQGLQIDSMSETHPPISCGPARFDRSLDAWILSRHSDVSAALLDDRLTVPGGSAERTAASRQARELVSGSIESTRSAEWSAWLRSSAQTAVARLSHESPIDLVTDLATPWSMEIAARVADVPPEISLELGGLARDVFLAAATTTSPGFSPAALQATATLTRLLAEAGGRTDAQSFVALSQTLPCVLAGAWDVLIDHPAEIERLGREPDRVDRVAAELLRLASPSRAVFRRAACAITAGGEGIAEGDTVILALAAANRDADRFPDPERFDPDRNGSAHLGFGRGRHGCPGAALVRQAVAIATQELAASTSAIERAGSVEWVGGFAIGGPAGLPVVLRRPEAAEADDAPV